MNKKPILAILVIIMVIGYYTHYSWSFEIINNSPNTVYYSFSNKLEDLKPLKPQERILENRRGFTHKIYEPCTVILAKEPFMAGQSTPEHTTYEFTAQAIQATIDKDSIVVVNKLVPAKKLFYGEAYSYCHNGSAFLTNLQKITNTYRS